MSKIVDFFKMLWNNPNVIDDEAVVEKDLVEFMNLNSASNKRISYLERKLEYDDSSKSSKPVVNRLSVNSKKSTRKVSREELEEEKEELER